jgi:hypothetical protein
MVIDSENLISEFDVIALADLFSARIETDDDYNELAKFFDEDE